MPQGNWDSKKNQMEMKISINQKMQWKVSQID
jgi:hypothetical protein